MTTLAAVLAAARAKLPANEARLLLGHVLGQAPSWLIAHDDEPIDEEALLAFASLVARRAGGEPVAYLIGCREFFGRPFSVSPAVLIPRPETELLVELALARFGTGMIGEAGSRRGIPAAPKILDLGTGSGCIAITLALELPEARVTAVDVSSAALQLATRNARGLTADVQFVQGDWLSCLDEERYDLIVSNPPYIASGDSHLASGDLRHEPPLALASGTEGLDAIRIIVEGACKHLLPGGTVMIEHGYDQAAAVRGLMENADLSDIRVYPDLAGILRVTVGNLQGTGESLPNSR